MNLRNFIGFDTKFKGKLNRYKADETIPRIQTSRPPTIKTEPFSDSVTNGFQRAFDPLNNQYARVIKAYDKSR